MNSFITTINNISTDVKNIAPPIAGIVLIIIGVLYMLAKDPNKKEMLHGWITNVIVGFVIVYSAASAVTWISNKTTDYVPAATGLIVGLFS